MTNRDKADKTMKRKNRILCKLCLDIIESKHTHDYVTCSCGAVSVDGGNYYFKRNGLLENMVDLSFPERLIDKSETQSHVSELNPDVKEAMDGLRSCVNNESMTKYRIIFHKASTLLNALDKQFMSEDSGNFKHIDNAEELSQSLMKENDRYFEQQTIKELLNKKESIWKPVSEKVDNQSIIFINKAGYARLAEAWNDKFYFIEGDAGGADVRSHMIDKTYYGKKFCTLTDFINDYEKLKERVKKLNEKC